MKSKNKTAGILHSWYDSKLVLFFEGILVGAIAGGLAVLFRLIIEQAGMVISTVYNYLSEGHFLLIFGWFLLLILMGISLGLLLKKTPMISGSGIPQVKGYLLRQFKIDWLKDLTGKFIGGILSLGFGLSLGREGPSIQLGASVGKGVSKLLKRSNIEEKYLVLGGAGAGLAAAFNAPLAGVVFVLEELQKSLSPAVLTCVMGACVAADFVSKEILGVAPVFQFADISPLPLAYYPIIIILGAACGVIGKIFNLSILKLQDLYAKIPKKLSVYKPVLPFLIVGVVGFFFPSILGGGHDLIIEIGSAQIQLSWILILIAAKLMFTSICYGSGVPGGIFLPLLVIGALIGKGFGIISSGLGMENIYEINFLILGMAAFFTGVVRAPVTGSILITEMTGSFHHLLPLLTVSMAAYVMTDVCKSFAIYDRLLERMLNKQKPNEFTKASPDKIIMEIPVSMNSYLENRLVRNIKWPMECLLVGVRRGEQEIIPNGNTEIIQGDFIIVLANKNQGKNLKMKLINMGQPQ